MSPAARFTQTSPWRNNVRKIIAALTIAASLFASAAAQAVSIHSVASLGAPVDFVAPGYAWQTPVAGNATFAWDDSNPYAVASANVTLANPTTFFEFKLLTATASTAPGDIIGLWDVFENGAPVCSACAGQAYGLQQSTGSAFKIYIDNSGDPYFYAGFITDEYDF